MTLSDVDDALLRIDELAARAASALAADGAPEPPSARVTPVPDRRMLRYYTTLGLLDRPAEVRGRTAYYGRRHLLQVVAVKRLQGAGATLAEIQRRLAGVSTAELEELAAVPTDEATSAAITPAAAPVAPRTPVPPRPAFWKQAPAATEPAAIRLAPGVTLVLDAARPLSPDDHAAVRAAAAGFVDHLSNLLEERP